MKQTKPARIELLAPARDASVARAAIDHGADAIYMGASGFGARAQAGNSVDDIRNVVEYAHPFGVRVYVTVNTIIYDNELHQVKKLIWDLWRAGVDALIVQDLSLPLLADRGELPPIAMHASTQCDIRTPEKARFLEKCGFTRLVLPRELTLDEIKEIRSAVSVDLEGFVHGALCVSYSGDCQASFMLTGRSANRGECCQVCRFKFNLEDGEGNRIITGKHLLSLRDMNRIDSLEQILDAGIISLKIEGRLKDAAYVKNVVASYRRALDRIIESRTEDYCRASRGSSDYTFRPDPADSFNRSFTDYFLRSKTPAPASLARFETPKWIGKKVGVVRRCAGNYIEASLDCELHNGDGLGFFNREGEFCGFRVNRADGNRIFPATDINIPRGTTLYRNNDKQLSDILEGNTATRRLEVSTVLRVEGNKVILTMRCLDGSEVSVAEEAELTEARSEQTDRRRRELEKLGDTIFRQKDVTDLCGNLFIPASVLSRLRRRGCEMLLLSLTASYKRETSGKMSENVTLPAGYVLSRHDNIANKVAAGFYAKLAGKDVKEIPGAIEVSKPSEVETRVMETRYCLRRELGKCLKTPAGKDLPTDLFLTSEGNRFRLEFDCKNCRMKLYTTRNGCKNK